MIYQQGAVVGQAWSDEEDRKLMGFVEGRMRRKDIAVEMNRSLRSVGARITRLTKREKMILEYTLWTEAEDSFIIAAITAGKNLRQIHREMFKSRSLYAVRARCAVLRKQVIDRDVRPEFEKGCAKLLRALDGYYTKRAKQAKVPFEHVRDLLGGAGYVCDTRIAA